MTLSVYKGFDCAFLSTLVERPLLEEPVENKTNVLIFDKKRKKQLYSALLGLDDSDSVWITYEEYTFIKTQVDEAIVDDDLKVFIYRNNVYPDYYPIPFSLSDALFDEIDKTLNGNHIGDVSDECKHFLSVYNSLVTVGDHHFGSFFNYEYDRNENKMIVKDYYPNRITIENAEETGEYTVFLNDDVHSYLSALTDIHTRRPEVIALHSTDGEISRRMQLSLQAYCVVHHIRIINAHEALQTDTDIESALIRIAREDIGIRGFTGFRNIRFYKNPDIDKEVTEISQGQIIQEIIRQAENAYHAVAGTSFRDIFITASTGAGKSVMFQIPAVYLAQKYHKLTIIIEPVKALMQDQKEKLIRNGYNRVETFNSDLISQIEKETVLRRIKSGDVDLLYLSPETLLSYSIETIIGEREIGLVIIDEAHIVTTWGVGFRPDYWYLGSYINRLRNQIQTTKGKNRKTYRFPICAFTATAVNGGLDDSVGDTIISLYMENPIKYLGYVRRDNISFEINRPGSGLKLPQAAYEEEKTKALDARIRQWLADRSKTIVYFPYASLARDAAGGIRGFTGITVDKRIGTYTGRNISDISAEAFNEEKRRTFDAFRNGETPVMFATKAFGLGVDVDDVAYVYHYAVSGNLCDYVQEIGRAARKKELKGFAVTDYFYNDINYMKILFGMSRIRQYQIREVLAGIYDTYLSKKGAHSFLISPESFTYIFNGKDENACINKLKICLLMIEKDFYDKYNFKVLISRPQGVFTKAFVCVHRDDERNVLSSVYGKYFTFIEKGKNKEKQPDGSYLSDIGDIYFIDLKKIWEEFHPDLSFPQFKYMYFNPNAVSTDTAAIMPGIRRSISPRQKINIEARGDYKLSDLREKILDDFEYIANQLYTNYRNRFFTTEEFARLIKERFGIARARMIANSLFQIADPKGKCVKHRITESTGTSSYSLAYGNFKEYMRRPILHSGIINNITRVTDSASYSGYLSLNTDEASMNALKLLSIFDLITYEVLGGEEPEIFIRLNAPEKIKSIVAGNTPYANDYVKRAQEKHDRDVEVLLRFFKALNTDEERWDYIENYFLGYDVLEGVKSSDIKK